jgi:hypothetical protein
MAFPLVFRNAIAICESVSFTSVGWMGHATFCACVDKQTRTKITDPMAILIFRSLYCHVDGLFENLVNGVYCLNREPVSCSSTHGYMRVERIS